MREEASQLAIHKLGAISTAASPLTNEGKEEQKKKLGSCCAIRQASLRPHHRPFRRSLHSTVHSAIWLNKRSCQ